ncbi:hypothetical protein [Bacteriovorax sp. Seq25_V]|uniref:hypothetical protein n=1 Tax=Bacteriovorax sp. Seq25_V TaxID=1201288 RepID=UPI00038A3227|nr:hypothetical protein [Bacteriovorax sp. Seq25_V]EQC45617.1 hypothetical protein M900_2233 [Bacteriovorax sp. Seq25_V]
MFKTLIFSLIISLNSYAAMTAFEVRDTWKKVESAFFEELQEKGEHILFQWSDDSVTKVAAMSHGLPRKLHVSSSLLTNMELKKEHLINVFCHELGHIIGGAPFIEEFPGDNRKISTEGQADYFATAKCMKRVLDPQEYEDVIIDFKVKSDLYKRGCTTRECQLISFFSLQAIQILGPHEELSFENVDNKVVDYTYPYKNTEQCRLDTFVAGAICPVSEDVNFSDESQSFAACHWRGFSTDFILGARPACWFRPFTLDSFY